LKKGFRTTLKVKMKNSFTIKVQYCTFVMSFRVTQGFDLTRKVKMKNIKPGFGTKFIPDTNSKIKEQTGSDIAFVIASAKKDELRLWPTFVQKKSPKDFSLQFQMPILYPDHDTKEDKSLSLITDKLKACINSTDTSKLGNMPQELKADNQTRKYQNVIFRTNFLYVHPTDIPKSMKYVCIRCIADLTNTNQFEFPGHATIVAKVQKVEFE